MYYPGYGVPATTTTTTYAAAAFPSFYTTNVAAPAMPMMPPTATYVTIPTSYTRAVYTYTVPYDRYAPFVVPYGVAPHVAECMYQASAIFRTYDLNFSGSLDYNEWRLAMHQLGYYMNDFDAVRLFSMIDTDRSGYISEREFVEYWVWSRGYAPAIQPPTMMAPPPMTTTTTYTTMAPPYY